MEKEKQATSHHQLIDELLDSRVAKTEREHAAGKEIAALKAKIERRDRVLIEIKKRIINIEQALQGEEE
jgi:hypothetical protein